MLKRVRLWLASLLGSERFDEDVADELSFHVAARADDLERRGLTRADARRRARLELGSPEKYRHAVRDVRTGAIVDELRMDVRYAARGLVRRPGFATAAALTLALGIGATTTVFSLLDAVLLRPLPVAHPETLAHIYTSCRAGNPYCSSSFPEYLDYRANSRTFADMAAFAPRSVRVADGGWIGTALLVSTNYFPLLGVSPAAGRFFSPAWNVAADPPVVLAYATWQSRFGGDPAIVGRSLGIGAGTFRVTGVAPPGFHGTRLADRPDIWIAIDNVALVGAVGSDPGATAAPTDVLMNRGRRWIGGTVGRLRDGMTLEQAQADMQSISNALQERDESRAGRFITVEAASKAALPPAAAADIRRFLILLLGGVGATLLIACANVAGLTLARGTARRPELDLRRALGAGRLRLVRQLAVEHLLLAAIGSAAGVLVARAALALLGAYDLPGAVSIASLDVQLDARMVLVALALFVVAGLFGLIPALGATHGLSSSASRTTAGAGAQRGQRVLLAVQVAVTAVLLVGAGLFIRSLQNGLHLDIGLTPAHVVAARIVPALGGYTPSRTAAVVEAAVQRLDGLPEVAAASAANAAPLEGGGGFFASAIQGYRAAPDEEIRFESALVAPGYFDVLGIPLLAGREVTTSDRTGAPLVGIVSKAMAERYWAGRSPVGTTFSSPSFPVPIHVIGVAGNVAEGLDGTAAPFVYLSLAQHPRLLTSPRPLVLLARTTAASTGVVASVRDVLRNVDPSLPVAGIAPLDDEISARLMPQRLGTALLSALGFLTILLVIVGAGGTVAYGVARRRREIGVRLALGAPRAQVAGAMTRTALSALGIGLAAGIIGALLLGRLASAFLYGIAPTDPVSFAAAAAILGLASGTAAFLPAWRASGIDPVETLRAD